MFIVIVRSKELKIVKKSPSKQKVIDAAISLFFQKGFHGTSVRDIADEANVNVSLISYYFKGKQGLLEFAVTDYYEQYLETIEETLKKSSSPSPLEQLKELITVILQYKQRNLQLSCMIHRELSLNSMFVREMTVTYLAKENYYINNLLSDILKNKKSEEKRFLNLQLKGMLITPYILHHEWRQHVVGEDSHQLFVHNFAQPIHDWLDFLIKSN